MAPVLTSQPRLILSGVAQGSPLMRLLTARLAGVAELKGEGAVTPSAAWRRAITDTGLQWFDGGVPEQSEPVQGEGVAVDLHGVASVDNGRTWRVVGRTGAAVLRPFFGLGECWTPLGVVPLRLIESTDGGAHWQMLAEVELSGLQAYSVLLEGLASAVAYLLATGLERPAAQPWQPRFRPRSTAAARLGYRVRSNARRLRDYARCELWAIGVLDETPDALVAGRGAAVSRWLEVPQGEGYVADPIPWPGRPDQILCEHWSHFTGRGSLRALTVRDGEIAESAEIALPVDCHLSYPFAWKEGERVLCLPEMGAARRQVMYELSPDAAPRPVCTVAENLVMADPTLFRWEDLYWIAYTDGDLGLYDNLCLLWAERVEGPWRPHRANPVKFDVRSSRGAGALFRTGGGELIRPAQDCSRTYGGAVVLNRVLACTTSVYREERVAAVEPDRSGRFPDGLHTFSVWGDRVLVDGKRYVVDLDVLRQRVVGRFRRSRHRSGPAPAAGSVPTAARTVVPGAPSMGSPP